MASQRAPVRFERRASTGWLAGKLAHQPVYPSGAVQPLARD